MGYSMKIRIENRTGKHTTFTVFMGDRQAGETKSRANCGRLTMTNCEFAAFRFALEMGKTDVGIESVEIENATVTED